MVSLIPVPIPTVPHAIEYINLEKPQTAEIVRLADNQDFSCVVNLPGSWSLSGVWTKDDRRTTGLYDLSMNYWENRELISL